MEHDLYDGQKRIWNILRKRKKLVNEEVQINNITHETCMMYFKNLLDGQEPTEDNENPGLYADQRNPDSCEITLEEVQKITRKSKKHRAFIT